MNYFEQLYYHNKYCYQNIKNYDEFLTDEFLTNEFLTGGFLTSGFLTGGAKNNDSKIKQSLWKYILKHSKPAYQARYEDDGKLINNVANKGLKINQIATRVGGEYGGLSIKALEPIKPILTDKRVSDAIKHIESGDIQKAIGILRLVDEVSEYGINIIYTVLKKWMEINEIPADLIPSDYEEKTIKLESKKILDWIHCFNWAQILGKFQIVDIGHGVDHPVVPESWLGRIYENAKDLHNDMNELEWRSGKPPVTFCVIYGMDIVEPEKTFNINDVKLLNVRIGVIILIKNEKVNSSISIFSSKKMYIQWLNDISTDTDLDYLVFDLNTEHYTEKLLIICKFNGISVKELEYEKKRNVGYLVSTMQKLIRRGPECSVLLKEIMTEIWKSPPYNLPEHQFLRVSASRQLVWRLYIMTIEDARAYDNLTNDPNILSMSDLACLAIIANRYPDVQFTEVIFNKLLNTALLVQRIDSKWDILNDQTKEIPLKETKNQLLNSMIALYYNMPARQWDDLLLESSFTHIRSYQNETISLQMISDEKIFGENSLQQNKLALLAGFDMHPYPNILILLQASMHYLPYDPKFDTTQKLWNFIWTYSSAINYRLQPLDSTPRIKQMLLNLQSIQDYYLHGISGIEDKISQFNVNHNDIKKIKIKTKPIAINHLNDANDRFNRRLGFLLLFSEKKTFTHKINKSHNKKYDIIIAGDERGEDGNLFLCKIKTSDAKFLESTSERRAIELAFFENYQTTIITPMPPIGYAWIWNDKHKITLKTIVKNNKIHFYANDIELKPFDASNVLEKLKIPQIYELPEQITGIVKRALYYDKENFDKDNSEYPDINDYQINLLMRELHSKESHSKDFLLYDWIEYAVNIPSNVWKSIYIKLHNSKNVNQNKLIHQTTSEIIVGPIDGSGNSLREPINYLYEGTIWRILNMFSMLYPKTIALTNAVKSLRFRLNPNNPEYLDLIAKIKLLGAGNKIVNKDWNKIERTKIKIMTKLWDHQKNTVDKIMTDILKYNRRGFGDASNVGAGKTLTTLCVMANLYNKNLKEKIYTEKGFLVLLPTTYLYKTWTDEIKKHTNGFDLVFQNANGTLSNNNDNILLSDYNDVTSILKPNSILITTLGRMRDHPIENSWIFVAIDECLSVQNKDALQVGEAWRQIIGSQYGVLLASATFFRTRFDKLFYMLKMLNSGLPENKNYLDAILSETIIANIPSKKRDWTESWHAFQLSDQKQKEYDTLVDKDMASDKLYMKLQNFLFDNFDYVAAFNEVIKKCNKQNTRCLIYAKSKSEADSLAQNIKGVTRFPDTSGKHLSISYTEGTYGLNNLIYLDTIVTRIPDPDKLPQMKGRLDRPNQKNDMLHIHYLYIDQTIDRAGKLRLEMANNFYNSYIMPLAEFYDLALNR